MVTAEINAVKIFVTKVNIALAHENEVVIRKYNYV